MGKRDDKTEAPTPKKKQEARKKGQVAKSQDLTPWATMLAATYAIPATISSATGVTTRAFESLRTISERSDPNAAVGVLGTSLQGALIAVLPLLAICLGVAAVTHFGQIGLVLSFHPLKPDIKRINPIKGLRNLFSPKSLYQTAKQVVKGALIGWLAYPHVMNVAANLSEHGRTPVLEGVSMAAGEMMGMIRKICWVVLIVAAVDYGYQKRQHRLDLKMSKQEIKDESKNSEGDPQTKGRIRGIQVSMARKRMMAGIADASVVITNPTHIAVALKYDPAAGGAPRIVALGTDNVAMKIREKARAAGIPIVEAKPLARALFRTCDVGDEIPVVLYEAVAKVLAFVRRLKGGILSASALPLPNAYLVDQRELEALPPRKDLRRRAAA